MIIKIIILIIFDSCFMLFLKLDYGLYYWIYYCSEIGTIFILVLCELENLFKALYVPFICKIGNELLNVIVSVFLSSWNVLKNEAVTDNDKLVFFVLKFVICSILFFNWEKKGYILQCISSNKYKLALGVLTVSFLFIKGDILFSKDIDKLVTKSMIMCGTTLGVIFTIIYLKNKYKYHQEQLSIQEENKRLASQLHKTKEVLPAVVSVLEEITTKGKATDADTMVLLQEMQRLYQNQMEEVKKEDLCLKTFNSTGLQVLDRQLLLFLQEAADKNINMDIFVTKPIRDYVEQLGLNQLTLQRSIGDMIRNAFRAIERCEHANDGNVLLILGYQQPGILEMKVLDDGENFPIGVLNDFGTRGITTGGTGNGLADLVGYANEEKASIKIEEYFKGENSFTKALSVVFNNKNEYVLSTARSAQIDNIRWNIV